MERGKNNEREEDEGGSSSIAGAAADCGGGCASSRRRRPVRARRWRNRRAAAATSVLSPVVGGGGYIPRRKQQNDIDSCSLLNRNEKSSMTVDVFSGATLVYKKSKEDIPFSPKSCPSHKQQSLSAAQSNSCNTISSGFKGSSSSKQLPTVNAIALYKNLSTENEDSIRGDNCKNIKIPLSSDKQRECKSLGPKFSLSTEEPTTSAHVTDPKKYSFMGKAVKKDTKDPLSLHNNRLSQKQQPNASNLNSMNSSEEMMRVSSITSSKKPTTRSEETTVAAGAASSPLTKLTSRLNFLKERGVQLVHELQNIDLIRSEGPEGPPSSHQFQMISGHRVEPFN